jgi:hypothetical protein
MIEERIAERVGADQLGDAAPQRLCPLLEETGDQLVQRADQQARQQEHEDQRHADIEDGRVQHGTSRSAARRRRRI